MRAVLVFLFPGASILSGVSSANRDVLSLTRFAMAEARQQLGVVEKRITEIVTNDAYNITWILAISLKFVGYPATLAKFQISNT